MDDDARLHWVANRILPLEAEVRSWLAAHAVTLSKADRDDVIQEAYARLWTANLQAVNNPRAYFYTVIRNLLAEAARHARIVPMERMGEIEALRIISEEPGPERRLSARQELAQLLSVVNQLPRQCRRAFELCKFEGLSQKQIAARMGIAEKTVEKHLAKALLRVMRALTAMDGNRDADKPENQVRHGRHRQFD